jgi:hypothetical protein
MAATAVVTPEDVMTRAIEGRVSTRALAALLTPEARREFFQACGRIEQRYTNECRDANEPCLESGCSMDGDRCLQPILRAGIEYDKACGAEWARLFVDGANRDGSWKATLATYEI